MQLILAADVSGSVNATRYKTQQDGYIEALGDSRVLNVIAELDPPVLAITFIAWSRDQDIMVPWTRVHDAKTMDVFREQLRGKQRPRVGINTLISRALYFCDAQFDREFTGGRKVIDVSGDGDDNQGIFAVREMRDNLVAQGRGDQWFAHHREAAGLHLSAAAARRPRRLLSQARRWRRRARRHRVDRVR